LASHKHGNHLVYEEIKAISKLTNNRDLNILIANFEEEPYTWSNSKGVIPINSKISLKREPWAKTRPFAILDYFSQSSLKGLHRWLFKWLSEQPEDGTFKQDEVSEVVRKWTETKPTDQCRVESADLSAATDSIPLEVQAEILGKIAGKHIAKSWMRIASDRQFKLPIGGDIKYTVGQPMGLLSSWAMLSVWHHIMLRSCMRYLNLVRCELTPVYFVIGDDVSMKGTYLFLVYQQVVGAVQGVGISKVKGYHKETQTLDNCIPFETNNDFMHTAELAKRVFCNGYEITIVPPDEVKTSLEEPIQFPEILKSLKKRGYPEIEIKDLPSLSALCCHKRLALLLSTNPITQCPLFKGVTPGISDTDPWKSIPWFKPGFDVEKFKLLFIKTLKEEIITVLLSVTTSVNKWITLALTGGEQKVKGWVYTCETQGLLLFLIAERCKNTLSELLKESEVDNVFVQEGEINPIFLKKYIGQLQIIFDIDLLFKEENINKEVSRRYFTNSIISKVLRKAVSG
jgi:hypothetical protein